MPLCPLVAKLGHTPAAMLALQDNAAACFLRQDQHISVHTSSSCVGSGACEDGTTGMKLFEGFFLVVVVLCFSWVALRRRFGSLCVWTRSASGKPSSSVSRGTRHWEPTCFTWASASALPSETSPTFPYRPVEGRRAPWAQQQHCRRGDNCLFAEELLTHSNLLHRPWVSSYFRKFPMHMYCLPVQAANHRAKRWGLSKRKWLPIINHSCQI